MRRAETDMHWNLIALDQSPAMRWRNGGGETRELIAWPASDQWQWRISVADVASDGPFSRFDDVHRCLAILEGAGVRLQFADRVVELTRSADPLEFSGEASVDCCLLDGPVRDLNLMTKERAGQMRRLTHDSLLQCQAGTVIALYCTMRPARVASAGGTLEVPPQTLAWCEVFSPVTLEIRCHGAIWMEIGALTPKGATG